MSQTMRKKFGKRIRELRLEKGWSQEQFADEVGVHRTYIGAVERGEQNIALDNIERVAKRLGISIEELFQGLS